MSFDDTARVVIFSFIGGASIVLFCSWLYWRGYEQGLKDGFDRGTAYQKYIGTL